MATGPPTMKVHGIQSSKAAKPDWCNENIHETYLKFMYGRTFNNPKNIHDKRVIVMNNNSEIYRACCHKTTFR